MQSDMLKLKSRRDALLDAIEFINTMIYEQRLALKDLERKASIEYDDVPERNVEY